VRVLVTGATGFTGNHLARHLHAAGHEVRALAREPEKARTLGVGISVVRGDLLDRDSLKAACRDIDVVYNIAALYRQAGLPKETYRDVNARGVGWLIEEAAACGVRRVVHCSTVGVHGDVEHPLARPAESHQVELLGPVDPHTKHRCSFRRRTLTAETPRRADGPVLEGRLPCWRQASETTRQGRGLTSVLKGQASEAFPDGGLCDGR